MDEVLFPVSALAVVFLVVMPLLTLASRAMLAQARRRAEGLAAFGDEATFAWLVVPTIAPLVWLGSSIVHQLDGASREVCANPHVSAMHCVDTLMLLGGLVALVAPVALWRAWRERPRIHVEALPEDHALSARVARLVEAVGWSGAQVVVARQAPAPAATIGWWRPRVVLDACFVRDADDAMIGAALLHERAHAGARDVLRRFVARLCLTMNPAGRALQADLARWSVAREAWCDRQAVARGADPLALAQGIVRAAKFRCGESLCGAALLCGHEHDALRLRVALLMEEPAPMRPSWGGALMVAVIVLSVATPHLGPDLLAIFHETVERWFLVVT